ncbi:antitoxin Xre/MbcA/ParS toxin-binding domain-containing protein [Pseudomonas sp. MAHUQ-62]|uniref:antitoxin Xre/MbcA/ParS toxin-binding domain-containing protein n=1 Tax=Pseudomonas sp. GCM10023245 TaxID=3252652 RepID=UPI00360B88E3
MLEKILADDYRRRRARLLGLPEDATDLAVHTHIIQGIPLAHLAKLLREGDIDAHACEQISSGVILKARLACEVIAPDAVSVGRLSADESDRLFRVIHALVVAELLFGSRDKARRWLSKPKARFSGKSPLQLLTSSAGAGLVEELLTQLAEGFVL